MPNRVLYSFIASDKFTAAARRIKRSTEGIRSKFKKLGPTAKIASAQVKGAVASMGRAIKGFMATSLGPMIAAFAGLAGVMKFFTLGTGFQDSIADLSAITFATGKDLEFLRMESLRLGKAAKVSSAEVANAFALVASAKSELLQDPKALSTITEQVLLLKNAAGIELADAANIALEGLNQFGAGADQAVRFVNVLAAGSVVGSSRIEQIGDAMIKAGPVAKLLNVGFEEINASLQVLAKGGLKGAEAGTQLKTAMLALNKVIPFEQVGGFTNALEKLQTLGLTPAQLETKVFGRETIAAAAILLDRLPVLKQWTKKITGTNVATKQAAIKMATLSAKARGLGVTVANFLIKAFDMLAPQFDGTIQKMEQFFDTIRPEQVEAFADRLGTVFKGIALVGKLAFQVFTLVSPLLSIVFKPLELLVALIDRLMSLPGALKLLAKFGGEAINDLTGGGERGEVAVNDLAGGGKLDVVGSTNIEQSSKTDVNVNFNAPKGVIQSVKSKTSGKVSGLNVGVNMVEGAA